MEDPGCARAASTGRLTHFTGFTLIELLVVVLIIGILASVALPQYKKAVDKTRLMKLISMTKSVVQAEEAYYLANAEYTQDWDSLAVSFAGTPVAGTRSVIRSSDGWQILLTKVNPWDGAANGMVLYDSHLSDLYLYAFYAHDNNPHLHGIGCHAKSGNAYANQLCKSVTGKITYDYGTVCVGGGICYVYRLE